MLKDERRRPEKIGKPSSRVCCAFDRRVVQVVTLSIQLQETSPLLQKFEFYAENLDSRTGCS